MDEIGLETLGGLGLLYGGQPRGNKQQVKSKFHDMFPDTTCAGYNKQSFIKMNLSVLCDVYVQHVCAVQCAYILSAA